MKLTAKAIIATLALSMALMAQQPAAHAPAQPTPAEVDAINSAYKDLALAQAGLQHEIDQVLIAHPGWKWDAQQRMFYTEPAPAAAKPAPEPAKK